MKLLVFKFNKNDKIDKKKDDVNNIRFDYTIGNEGGLEPSYDDFKQISVVDDSPHPTARYQSK